MTPKHSDRGIRRSSREGAIDCEILGAVGLPSDRSRFFVTKNPNLRHDK